MEAEALLRRLDQLKSDANVVRQTHRACYEMTFPLRGSSLSTAPAGAVQTGASNLSQASTDKGNLYTSAGTDAGNILASGLVSGVTPSNVLWVGFGTQDASQEEKEWFDSAAETVWKNIHNSNFDSVIFDAQTDMVAAGMFALFVEEGEEGGYHFDAWDLATCYCAASKTGGPIDTVFREISITCQQAVKDYGENMVGEDIRKKSIDKPDETVVVVIAIYPREKGDKGYGKLAKNMPVASCHILKAQKTVVRESGFHEMPVIVPRWKRIPSSVYAVGPVYDALPDIRTLNEQVKFVLANMDLATAGMWGAVDDGVINPKTVRVGPRKIVVMASKDSFFPLQPAARFEPALLMIEKLEGSIRKTLMADQLQPQDGPQMTATEVYVRVELIRQLLGPIYGRLMAEFVQPLIKRCFGLAYRAGVFDVAPESLRSRNFNVEYLSPLARSQKLTEVNAMDRLEDRLGATSAVQPEVLDVYKWDEAQRKRGELLGVPADLLRDDDETEDYRKAKAKLREQKMAAATITDTAKNVIEAQAKQAA